MDYSTKLLLLSLRKELKRNIVNGDIFLFVIATSFGVSLAINCYMLAKISDINVNFLFSSAIFGSVCAFLVTFMQNKSMRPMFKRYAISSVFGIAFGALFYMAFMVLGLRYADIVSISNNKESSYYYKANFFHRAGEDCQAVWRNGGDANITFAYPDKKLIFVKGVLQSEQAH
ncbi:hypothetical protein [Campylobacter sp. RM16188]|uniref:hypothetical protein n=1 Tax=Campylobacter sp. RM16188 TaxID=1705725 RepID=UPI0015535453|nr:hypothetical protein [Campylobacter sp. RM16188]